MMINRAVIAHTKREPINTSSPPVRKYIVSKISNGYLVIGLSFVVVEKHVSISSVKRKTDFRIDAGRQRDAA